MARPSVYFDPGGVAIRPAASPVNLSNQFYAQPVETLDLMPLIEPGLWAANRIQGAVQRNQAQEQEERKAKAKAEMERAEKEALAYVANSAEGLIGARDQYLATLEGIDANEGANPFRQAFIAEKSGEISVRRKYRDKLMAMVEQAGVLTGPDGLEQFPLDAEKLKRDLWKETVGSTYALTILDGAAAGAKEKLRADAEFDEAVRKKRTEARIAFGNEMESNAYFDLIQSYGAIEAPSQRDDDILIGNIIETEKRAAQSRGKLGATNTRANMLAGIERGIRKMDDPRKMMSLLATVEEIRLDNGLVIGTDEKGLEMVERLQDEAYQKLTRQRANESADRSHKEAALKTSLRERFFKSINDATNRKDIKALEQLNGQFDDFVANLSGDEQTTALAERENWTRMINAPATAGSAKLFSHHMTKIRMGADYTAQIPMLAESGLFSPTQLGDLIEANKKGRDVNGVLKNSTFEQVKDKVKAHVERKMFVDARNNEDQKTLRGLFESYASQTLDSFETGARTLAETLVANGKATKDDTSQLDLWINEALNPKTGITVEVDKKFEEFSKRRTETLAKIEAANAVGVSTDALKDAVQFTTATELRNLERENRERQDPTRFMSIKVPSERWEDFDKRVKGMLLTELGAVGADIQDALPEEFRPGSKEWKGGIEKRVHATAIKAFSEFRLELAEKQKSATGWDAATFDSWASGRLQALTLEQLYKDFKDALAPPPEPTTKIDKSLKK